MADNINMNIDEVDSGINDSDDEYEIPPDNDMCDMLDEVNLNTELPIITDRYFIPYYKIDVQKKYDDICIRIHSNRICMLSLAPSHALLQNKYEIEKLSFKVTEKLDRTANKISRKGKRGAQPMQANSNICIITCTNGEVWPIKCCIFGKLIEVNESLVENPQLLKKPPHKGGYIAIILPNIKIADSMKNMLLTEDDYKAAIDKRENIFEEVNNFQNGDTSKRARDNECPSSDKPEKMQKI